MCGICGLWHFDGRPVDAGLLAYMRDSMAHRGPDGAGSLLASAAARVDAWLFREPGGPIAPLPPAGTADCYDVGLAQRRLSIIDLATGDQPMSNADGSLWIVYNGEIYNYRELRADLNRLGHEFRTASDTEVILHAYAQYGAGCPAHLNGIFAFAIWDARHARLFLARDHFGVKPLYYLQRGQTFYFASEMKAILADPTVPRSLDLDALNLCLTLRQTPAPWTLLQGVRKLPAGCSLTITREGELHQTSFMDSPAAIDRRTREAEWVARLQDALQSAVVGQMVSDVPIGLSLSSGVDSSTVLALMSTATREPVQAFTVGFAGRERSSEIGPAQTVAARFGAEFHSQVIAAADYQAFMQRYIWHLEEPLGNESAAAYFFVAEMAHRRGIKVLLNGQGADEPFAGYERYLWAAYGRWLRLAAAPPAAWLAPRLLGRGTERGERYQRFLYTAGGRGEAEQFLRMYSILSDTARGRLVRPDTARQMDPGLALRYVTDQLAGAPAGTVLERMTWVDTRTSLPDNLLLAEDKMAMAASVEARVPFLDRGYMALAEQIPGRFKLRGLRDKYIHRRACAGIVGQDVSRRRKIGFDNAMDLWLKAELAGPMQAATLDPNSFTATYLNPEYVATLMQEHASGQRDHQRILFLLLSIESWFGVFMRHWDRNTYRENR